MAASGRGGLFGIEFDSGYVETTRRRSARTAGSAAGAHRCAADRTSLGQLVGERVEVHSAGKQNHVGRRSRRRSAQRVRVGQWSGPALRKGGSGFSEILSLLTLTATTGSRSRIEHLP